MMSSGSSVGWVLMFLAVTVAAILFARRSHQRGAAPVAITAGIIALVSGLVTAFLAGAHLVVVLKVALERTPVVYDFRLYSLLLLGALLGSFGLLLAFSAAGLARQNATLSRRARNAALMLLAINVPLIPIQAFAILITALASVTLVAVHVARLRSAAEQAHRVTPAGTARGESPPS